MAENIRKIPPAECRTDDRDSFRDIHGYHRNKPIAMENTGDFATLLHIEERKLKNAVPKL